MTMCDACVKDIVHVTLEGVNSPVSNIPKAAYYMKPEHDNARKYLRNIIRYFRPAQVYNVARRYWEEQADMRRDYKIFDKIDYLVVPGQWCRRVHQPLQYIFMHRNFTFYITSLADVLNVLRDLEEEN